MTLPQSASHPILLKPSRPWALSATAPMCRATACPPGKSPVSGPAAELACCRSKKKPSPAWTKMSSPCPSRPPATPWPGPASPRMRSAPCGLALNRTPTRSNPPPPSWLRPSAPRPHVQAADWEFACKAGTEAMVAAIGLVGSSMADYALAIGMDTAQGRPGDALEYTAGSRRGGLRASVRPRNALAIIDSLLFLCHRYARFLAARIPELPRARSALHRRTGLLQAHHRSRAKR